MTAGSGVLHIETPPESLVVTGGLFHAAVVGESSLFEEDDRAPLSKSRTDRCRSCDLFWRGVDDQVIAGDIDGPKGRVEHIPHHHLPCHGVSRPPGGAAMETWLQRAGLHAKRCWLGGAEQVPMQTGRIAVFMLASR